MIITNLLYETIKFMFHIYDKDNNLFHMYDKEKICLIYMTKIKICFIYMTSIKICFIYMTKIKNCFIYVTKVKFVSYKASNLQMLYLYFEFHAGLYGVVHRISLEDVEVESFEPVA